MNTDETRIRRGRNEQPFTLWAIMTADEVLRVAHQAAVDAGWPWQEPISVTRRRLFFIFGPATWHVMSNAECRGVNVNVHVDDETGKVISKAFAPR